MKNKLKIVDYMFAHAAYSTDYQESEYIVWDRTPINLNDKYVFYTDHSLDRVQRNNKINFAWLLESPDITSQSYKWISLNNKLFTKVLTHSKELLDRGENFIFCPTGGCWIKPNDQKIYDKSKLISIIASSKRMTHGHNLRHKVIQQFMDKLDIYGRIYNPIDYKLTALKDYAFSITIENTNKDYYFTEKLIDCFMTGTVPIYWGCPSIGNFFNTDGMIFFDTVDDLFKIFENLSFDKYESMKNAIMDNFERAKEYLIAEDYIYKKYLEKYE
jgi:hypothetical protein